MGSLRAPGSTLLISCYELGHQPLGIALPLAFLERAGYNPSTLDLFVERLDAEKIALARFIAVSVPMHTALRLGMRAVQRIREINPICHVCFYGLYATLNAEYLLAHGVDSVIGGEYEGSLVALVQALEAGQAGTAEGISQRHRITGPTLKRLSFPVASRGALPPLEHYARLQRNEAFGLVGYTEASRGCLHHCLHCPIPPVYGGRLFVVPQAVVLDDIRQLVAAGATHITFGDADFLNGPGHSMRIVRAMHSEFPRVSFDFTAKIEHIVKYHTLFPELAALGCLFVVSAVESLSDTVLAKLRKGHTRADVLTALRMVRSAGMALRPSLVAFTPWTTAEDYLELFDFVEREGLIDHVDPVQYTIRLLIPPGSLLLSQTAMRPYLGALDPATFSYRWTHTDPRMDSLHQTVSAAVERATRANMDPEMIFHQLRSLARAALGVPESQAVAPELVGKRRSVPRLTEPWFC